MKFTTRTEYGLVSLIHMAHVSQRGRITIKELAEKEHYPYSYIEKIFQSLRAANIVVSYQGNTGGYALARPAAAITLKQIVEALEGTTFDLFCDGPAHDGSVICNHATLCGLRKIWQETKETLDRFFDSVTLETMLRDSINVGAIQPVLPKGAAVAETGGSV